MSSTQTASFVPNRSLLVRPKLAALAFPAILAIGYGLRIGIGLALTHVPFSGETMQYFEQGHRLAYGSGVVPWEFLDGIHSWLVPGLIALAMRATAHISDDPVLYIGLVRAAYAAVSMVVVFVAFRMGERESGLPGAIVAGGFCAIWFDLIYFAPAVMNEALAAHCAIAALFLGEGRHATRRVFWTGALFGAAVCLRYHYAPAVVLAVAWQYRRHLICWRWLVLGFGSVLLLFAGVLDAITWGAPFQSIWLHFNRNLLQGIAAAVSTAPADYYLKYLIVALTPLPLMLALAVIGATRFPALAIAAVAALIVHTLLPHKEVRFIYLSLAAASILIGLGAATVFRLVSERFGRRPGTAAACSFLASSAALSWFIAAIPMGERWHAQRGMVQAFLAAHWEPGLCGLQVRDIPATKSGGYTYLNRDVPLTFDPYVPEFRLSGVTVPSRFMVERAGGPVPQLRSPWSHLIAEADHAPEGFQQIACFPAEARADESAVCLFRRPDGCR